MKRGRPKRTWMEAIGMDLKKYNPYKDLVQDRPDYQNGETKSA